MNKNIILIDQAPLIQSAIGDLESWHEKIEKLEIEIQRFQDHDLKLYNEWYGLTSQVYQKELNEVSEAYRKIADFHNWIIFTVQDQDVSLAEAYCLMAQEEERFQNGSEDEKNQIQKIRELRNKAIEGQIHGEPNPGDEYSDERISDEPSEEEKRQQEQEQLNHARAYHENELHYFDALTDKDIRKIMKDSSDGLMLLVQCVTVCLETYRFDVILKVWNATSPKIKKTFNRGFQKEFGMTLDALLDQAANKARHEAGVDDDDEDFDFAGHYENPFTRSAPKKAESLPEDSELAKIYYRRLMLKVHPDKLGKDFAQLKKPWLDRLWKKIQTAYNDVNVISLQNLYLQVLISLKHYDEVTYSELRLGSGLLKKEFVRIRDSQSATLSHPAWGFSALKSYKKLEKKIAQPYVESKKQILSDKIRLEDLHASLRNAADAAIRRGGFDPPIKRRKRRARRRR